MGKPIRRARYAEIDTFRGERIAAAMRARGMDYNCQLCYDIGVAESSLCRWRQGRPISLAHAAALSLKLGISLDYLLLGSIACEHDNFAARAEQLSTALGRLPENLRHLVWELLQSLSKTSATRVRMHTGHRAADVLDSRTQ